MADDVIKSKNATSGNFFDGGNGRNIGLENDKYDLEKDLLEYGISLNEQAGNLTAEEAAKQRQEGLATITANHEAAIKGIKTQSAINVAANITGVVLSLGAAASAAGAKVITAKGAQVLGSKFVEQGGKQVMLKGTSLTFNRVGNEGLKVSVAGTMKNMLKNATVGSFKGAKGIKGLLSGVVKSTKSVVVGSANVMGAMGAACLGKGAGHGLTKLITGAVRNTVGMAVISAPLITTQIVTRNISDKKTAELNDAIQVLSDGCMYYNDCYDSLTADQKEQYERLQGERDKACTALLEDYAGYMDEEGNFTDKAKAQEFYEKYELIEQAAAMDLSEQTKAWQGYADYVTHEGIANKLAESVIDNEVDVDQFRKSSTYGDMVFSDERSAGALENAKAANALQDDLDDSGFLGFIDKVHDTLIHYLPVLSYVEAGLKIGADRLMEGVSGLFKFNYDEKYEGVGIGDLASSISADAEADQEKREQIADLEKQSHNNAITDVTEYKDAAANGGLTAENGGSTAAGNAGGSSPETDPSLA